MPDRDGSWSEGWPSPRVATDIQLVIGAVGLLWLVTLGPGVASTPLRFVVAGLITLFVPGYALLAALFPGSGTDDERTVSATVGSGELSGNGVDGFERVVLAVGASIALVSLTGVALNVTPWGLRLIPVLAALTLVTLPSVLVAAVRRRRLSPDVRYEPEIVATVHSSLRAVTNPNDRVDGLLTVVLLLSVCLAVGTVAYTTSTPTDRAEFSELYLLTETEDGELVAGGYPETLQTGSQQPIVVGIGNYEDDPTNYTVVAELQRVRPDGNRSVVTERQVLDRFSRRVAASESEQFRRTLAAPRVRGERLRVQFRLYRGDAQSPYQTARLWVSVPDGA
ncbi:DUF1616 domain-containing protein [Halomicroarcula sp. S1AR25-4]|uniref:DUF1616 domain-containing protein n=1 Tax=Haloarcula sp. S1AR25-4 TaxID=2950538 RepID=UPI002874FF6F|nr:DUF1616 domain-containing protein [Halomicroarcula sp. S1AR25-4]MDS0278500.1 DUF1616 domain-containing protein [Halomicroarcula sp. S1AR25-4]